MAVYAIGDIQGCHDELLALLASIDFDSQRDHLWLVGDLVNRGPKSLEVLRFVRSLGERAVCVLGNHDLHLLAIAAGNHRKRKNLDTLAAIFDAPDREELLDWLRHRPLLHHDPELGFAMLHAGLPPQWDIHQAITLAAEVEAVLRSDAHTGFFHEMYGNKPQAWSDQLRGMDRLRFITNCFTRLRYCDTDGNLSLSDKGPPGSQQAGSLPWFDVPGRRSQDTRILFGHWSTLGYVARNNVWALDTGCLWGGMLTAVRLDSTEPTPYSYNCRGQQDPNRFV